MSSSPAERTAGVPGTVPVSRPAPGVRAGPPAGVVAFSDHDRARRASWFELFCDLVFAATVQQVTHRLQAVPGTGSVLGVVALFVPVWWTWVLYTDRANRLDRDDAFTRLLTISGMAGVCGMAVFLGQVGHGATGDAGFVVCYLTARWMVTVLHGWAGRGDVRFKALARSFAAGALVSSALWLGGLLVPEGSQRWALWAAGMAVELALPFLAGRRTEALSSDADHLAERFGLFTIIVLGEAVTGFVGGLTHTRTEPAGALDGLLAFAVAACLWWAYFSVSSSSPGSHARLASHPWLRHAFVYGHLPMQGGLAMAGGTLGAVISGHVDHLSLSAAACLAGGVAVFHAVGALVRAAFTGLGETVVLIRLTLTVAVLAVIPFAPGLPLTVVLAVLVLILAAAVLAEQPGHRRRMTEREGGG